MRYLLSTDKINALHYLKSKYYGYKVFPLDVQKRRAQKRIRCFFCFIFIFKLHLSKESLAWELFFHFCVLINTDEIFRELKQKNRNESNNPMMEYCYFAVALLGEAILKN